MKELSFEKSLFLYFNGKHSPFFDWLMSMASNQFISIPFYLIFIFILVRTLKYLNTSYIVTNTILVLSCISLMIVVSRLVLPTVFEHLVSRIKPCYDSEVSSLMHLVGGKSGHHYGFYTFRACAAFAISTFLFLIFDESFKWVKILLLSWAVFVAYSRIYLGAHYPADVIVSVLSGALLGYLIYRMYFYIKDSVLVI
ncbi:MAG: putative rane-associated phospholipid phosphatase [Bacteroidetes bacterium]|nr:putative rane-associated phospholipid phosphatase [Bacteroidota bacterium]